MKIKDIVKIINDFAPPFLQESYDNAGLIIGDPDGEVNSVLLTIDVTEDVIDEAIKKKDALIISHHPIIFGGIKKITGNTYTERCIIKAIHNDIAIFSVHTNIDSVFQGVNNKICQKLNLQNINILNPKENILFKLVTFVPVDYIEKVQKAIFSAGAGHIGEYDSCSFNVEGVGTFKAGEKSSPFVGKKGTIHKEQEIRFETVFPKYKYKQIIDAMIEAHPYEEVAYDIYPIANKFCKTGMGMIGELEKPLDENKMLEKIKKVFKCQSIRHTKLLEKPVKKVAVCGGSGSFLLQNAINAGADIFISGDFKYHQFFDADNKIVIADIGHFESEQFTTEIFYDVLTKNLTTFAIHFSEVNTNPINYF